MKKIAVGIMLAFSFVAAFILIKQLKKGKAASSYHVGILQTASHPALDASREGFMNQLKHMLGDRVEFVIHNAQGNIAQIHATAQQMHANKELDAFFAIATPAAQALSALEKKRPIILSAVTDPAALGLIYPDTNATGVSDMINVPETIEMITQLLPEAKTIALLYTSGETNSIVLADLMRTAISNRGLTALDFAISNEADMQTAMNLACRKADVILAPTDNTVAASISLIAGIAQKNKTPLIVSDNMLVAQGALAARGVDYYTSGEQAAHIAYTLLVDKVSPGTIPVALTNSDTIYINKDIADSLGITIPDTLQSHVQFVG